ncbi:MAG: tetratricopeptide repeat protein [candidate division Zixibacteria bacterium]|nr:tetratricopeptide repeat protein [candidate division Zixibacteria bacterium]
MRQNIKITKKDLKQDKFTSAMFLGKDYFLENWIIFAGGLAAIFLVVFGIVYMQSQSQESDYRAGEIYNRAMGQFLNNEYGQAIVDFQMILSEYSSSEYAEQAAFNLANTHFAKKDYPIAQQAFEDYLNKFGDDPFFTTSAISGVAACIASSASTMDAVERYNQVGDKYRKAAEEFPEFKPSAKYYVNAMKYYAMAGNIEAAAEVYSILSEQHENTQYFRDASLIAGEYSIPQ